LRVLDRLSKDIEALDKHPHSSISETLRLDVLEHELYYRLNSNYMMAWAALSSHANADLKLAIGTFNKLCKDVRNTMPFIRFDKVNDDITDELQQAIDLYKKLDKENAGSKST